MLPAVRQGDPFFNPNLASGERKPALARPNDPTAEQRILDILRAYGLAPAAVVEAPVEVPVDAQGDAPSKDAGGAGWELAQPTPWPQAAAARRESSLEALSILLLTHDLSLSGAPLMLAQLAVELADRCAKLAVLSAEDGPLRALYDVAGIPVQVDASLDEPIGHTAAITRALAGFDLVLCNTIVSWPGVHAAAAFNKLSVLWLHESQYGYELAAAHPGVAEAIRSADLVVLPTHHLARLYREFLPENRFAVVPNGLDVRHLQAAAHPAQPAAGQPAADSVSIVCIGSLEPRKGQDFLLAALRLLPKQTLKSVTVDMLGRTIDPAFAAGLRQVAVPNVRFVGETDHAAVMAHLAGADIFVLPSRDEVLPVTLLEAMAHGVAIIAANVGGVSEAIVHEHSGLIVEFGDTRALARALQRLLAEPTLRRQLGHNAQTAFYARFTMDRFAAAMTDLLQQVVGSRPVAANHVPLRDALSDD